MVLLLNGTDEIMKMKLFLEMGLKKFNHWDRDGNHLVDGNGYYKEYWYDDIVLMEGEVKNGLLNGEWKFYYGGGTSRPESKYVYDSENGKYIDTGEHYLSDNMILIGDDSINSNYTYPLRLGPEAKNQIVAIVTYEENPAPMKIMWHENWIVFIPQGKNYRWFKLDGTEVESLYGTDERYFPDQDS